MNEEFHIPNTTLLVDHYGNVYDSSTKSIITSELLRIGNHVYRLRALIVNTYITNGRYDLLKNINKPVYLITAPDDCQFYSVNLKEFCEDEGLNYERMKKASMMGHETKDGWSVTST
jgi:hypothetical protein